jgi:hypothetical protein
MGMQTEFSFTLPKGYVDREGALHRDGVMRLATARDEIEPLRDPRVTGPEDPYLTILVLSRVITRLGSLPRLSTQDVEGFFAADLAFCQDLYGIINFGDPADVARLQQSVLPPEPDPEPEPQPQVAEPAADAPPAKTAGSSPRRRVRIEEVSHAAES